MSRGRNSQAKHWQSEFCSTLICDSNVIESCCWYSFPFNLESTSLSLVFQMWLTIRNTIVLAWSWHGTEISIAVQFVLHTLRKLYFHFLSHWMGYDRGDSFPFDFQPNGIPFGSKSKGKLSPRSYPIHCERKWKHSFSVCVISVHAEISVSDSLQMRRNMILVTVFVFR